RQRERRCDRVGGRGVVCLREQRLLAVRDFPQLFELGTAPSFRRLYVGDHRGRESFAGRGCSPGVRRCTLRSVRVLLSLSFVLAAQTARAESPAQELRIVARNSLVFIDSVREGEPRAEWAPYRVVDEMRPVIFKVDGRGRLVIKLRTFLEATNREAIGVV